jgi:hypothetical protein
MADTKIASKGAARGPRGPRGPTGPAGPTDLVTDSSLQGNGTEADPLGIEPAASAQIQITAQTDAESNLTFSAVVVSLSGGVVFGGLDESFLDLGYLKIILTLTEEVPFENRLPVTGISFPAAPIDFFTTSVLVAIAPVSLQTTPTDASLFQPCFPDNAQPNVTEILNVTYDLIIVSRNR